MTFPPPYISTWNHTKKNETVKGIQGLDSITSWLNRQGCDRFGNETIKGLRHDHR
jgi:hypothetical protein